MAIFVGMCQAFLLHFRHVNEGLASFACHPCNAKRMTRRGKPTEKADFFNHIARVKN
jgi:hypothetical protein